jgi:hypothetical protein
VVAVASPFESSLSGPMMTPWPPCLHSMRGPRSRPRWYAKRQSQCFSPCIFRLDESENVTALEAMLIRQVSISPRAAIE